MWRRGVTIHGITECDKPETARSVHQPRNLLVRVADLIGRGIGPGNVAPFPLGAIPELGLTEENSVL